LITYLTKVSYYKKKLLTIYLNHKLQLQTQYQHTINIFNTYIIINIACSGSKYQIFKLKNIKYLNLIYIINTYFIG